jgi:hypothetical protein
MKYIFSLLSILISFTTLAQKPTAYFMAKQPKVIVLYSNIYYILAEKRGDSLQIWYGRKGTEDSDISTYYETETLLCAPGKGKHFDIKKITKNRIVGTKFVLHKVQNFKKYSVVKNSIVAVEINEQYKDSVIKIRKINFGKSYYANNGNSDSLKKLINTLDFETFPLIYKAYVFANIKSVYEDVFEKQKLYEKLQNGTVVADSLLFKKFINNYQRGDVDHKILVYILVNKPELFYLRKMNVNNILTDEMVYCNDCFTAAEKTAMYNSLLPWRDKCPDIFWMFDQKGQHKVYIDY